MKKVTRSLCAALLACALILSVPFLFGCSSSEDGDGINVVCTIFPLYDWTTNIVADTGNVNIQLLVKNGTDTHSFQPSFADAAAIRESDVIIYVGGESDAWVEQSISEDTVAIKLSELDGITLREVCSDSLAEDHSHHGHSHSEAFDEHLWLSLENAKIACEAIRDTLSALNSDGADNYSDNTKKYVEELEEVDQGMEELSKSIDEPLIFADRFPFVYLLEDYGIDYYAAYEGCSAEKDADMQTVVELTNRIKSSSTGYIFTTESPDKALVDNVLRTVGSGVSAVSLDSMQSVSQKELPDASYLDIMRANLSALEEIFKN